jgi:Domain of unknown function (DUF4160)
VRDHPEPHFHARYAGSWAQVAIADGRVLAGSLPPRAFRLTTEWAELHRAELEANWARAHAAEPLETIAPLP